MFSFTYWLAQHWFEAVQTSGILGGLIFTATSLRDTRQSQKITNLFTLTQYQRLLYSELSNRPELERIFHSNPDLQNLPVTEDERLFLTMVVLHLSLALTAMRMNAIVPIEGLERDLAEMFSKPIPRAVWKKIRSVQNRDVRDFLDRLTVD
jgi:hypothetical protein